MSQAFRTIQKSVAGPHPFFASTHNTSVGRVDLLVLLTAFQYFLNKFSVSSGLTQRSRTRDTKSGQKAHFNHPFEVTLYNNTATDEDRGNRPRLFVEVCQ